MNVLVPAGHAVAALAVGLLVLAGVRWIGSRSRALGAIVAAAIAVRLVLGIALFCISSFHLPVARSLQLGGGFWQVALDATGYHQMAARAVAAGRLFPLDHSVPAPFFVDTLAVWMMAVGVSPIAGMFLNLLLYTALAVLVVWSFAPVNDVRRDLPCLVGVVAYSFSPVILFHSTQPLKDELSAFLLALACAGVVGLRPLFGSLQGARDWSALACGTAAVSIATFGTAGIRWYFGFMIWCALALAVAAGAVMASLAPGISTGRLRRVAAAAVVLVAVFLAFRAGSGPFYRTVIGANLDRLIGSSQPGSTLIGRITAAPSTLNNMVQVARTGFLMSGGGTNVVVPLRKDSQPGLRQERELEAEMHASAAYREREAEQMAARGLPPPAITPQPAAATATQVLNDQARAARAIPITMLDYARTVASGLAVMFVPMAILQPLTGLAIEGGRGLLSIADADTVFLDAMTLLVCVLLWQRRQAIGDRRIVVAFGAILGTATALLLGYVVTNFGTLWRMRPLATVPLWLLVIALSPRPATPRGSCDLPRP